MEHGIVKFSNIHADREGWLEARRGTLGSSDIATIAGLNPYKGRLQLWHEMTDRLVAPDLSENDSVWLGVELEPIVAKMFERKCGIAVTRNDSLYVHPAYYWASATPDYFTAAGEILEIKTTGAHGLKEWADAIPTHYQIQIQWQMGVCGIDKAVCACLVGGNQLVIHRLEFDTDIWAQLVGMGENFMRCIAEDIEPIADVTDTDLLPKPIEGTSIELNGKENIDLLEQYKYFKGIAAQAAKLNRENNKRATELGAQLRQKMGSAQIARIGTDTIRAVSRTRAAFTSAGSSWVELKIVGDESNE